MWCKWWRSYEENCAFIVENYWTFNFWIPWGHPKYVNAENFPTFGTCVDNNCYTKTYDNQSTPVKQWMYQCILKEWDTIYRHWIPNFWVGLTFTCHQPAKIFVLYFNLLIFDQTLCARMNFFSINFCLKPPHLLFSQVAFLTDSSASFIAAGLPCANKLPIGLWKGDRKSKILMQCYCLPPPT